MFISPSPTVMQIRTRTDQELTCAGKPYECAGKAANGKNSLCMKNALLLVFLFVFGLLNACTSIATCVVTEESHAVRSVGRIALEHKVLCDSDSISAIFPAGRSRKTFFASRAYFGACSKSPVGFWASAYTSYSNNLPCGFLYRSSSLSRSLPSPQFYGKDTAWPSEMIDDGARTRRRVASAAPPPNLSDSVSFHPVKEAKSDTVATSRKHGIAKEEPVETSLTPEAKPPGIRALLLRLVKELDSAERRRLLIALGALVTSSATNLMFPTIIGKALDFSVESNAPLLSGSSSRSIQDVLYSLLPYGSNSFKLACGAGSIFAIGAASSWVRVLNFGIATHVLEQRLRRRMFTSMMMFPTPETEDNRTSEQLIKLLQDVEVTAKTLTTTLASALRSLNSTIGATTMLLLLSKKLTFVSLSVIPLAGACAMLYGKYSRRVSSLLKERINKIVGFADERLRQIKTVQLFGQQERECERVGKSLSSLLSTARAVHSAEGLYMGGLSIALNVSLLAVLTTGGVLVNRGDLTIGSLTSFCLYSSMLGLGASGLSQIYGECSRASISIQNVFEVLDKKEPAKEENDGTIMDVPVSGNIDFHKVSFSYPSRPSVPVLTNLSLACLPGKLIVLTGASGSGKSTLISLITKLSTLSPKDSGDILLDKQPLQNFSTTWLRRKVIGVVEQEPVLFAGSIKENIAYGVLDSLPAYEGTATKPTESGTLSDLTKEIEAAAKMALCHDFIMELPEKYETVLGEQGKVALSVGQKKRIAIARTLLKKPKILIMDEATSALDGEAEKGVLETLANLKKDCTVILVAHKPTVMEKADQIFHLHNGSIQSFGTFEELRNSSPSFHELVNGSSKSV